MPSLTAIHRYPVKSLRGESLAEAVVEPWGLDGDRRWMLVDADGGALTAREVPRLVLLTPTITDDGGLLLDLPGQEPLRVPRPDPGRQVPVRVFSSTLTAAEAPDPGEALSSYAGRPVRLVWLDDPRRRPTDAAFGDADDRVSLADGYPLLLTTEESLAALDGAVLEAAVLRGQDRDPLPMARFRPNVVVRGEAAWAEDEWRRLRIGAHTFRAVKGCARCVMTTVDPATGEREHEPLATLARLRRFDGGVWFGMNLVPDAPTTAAMTEPLRLGDDVEVLERAEPGSGPPRRRRQKAVAGDP